MRQRRFQKIFVRSVIMAPLVLCILFSIRDHGHTQTRVLEMDPWEPESGDGAMAVFEDETAVQQAIVSFDEKGEGTSHLWLDHKEWLRLNQILRRFIEEGKKNLDQMIELDQKARRLKGQLSLETNRYRALKLERDDLQRRLEEVAQLGRTVQEQAKEERQRLLDRIAQLERRIKEAQVSVLRQHNEPAGLPSETSDSPIPPEMPASFDRADTAQHEETGDKRRIRVLDAASFQPQKSITHEEKLMAKSTLPRPTDTAVKRLEEMKSNMSMLKQSVAALQNQAARVHYNMGNAFFRRGQYRRAYEEYKKAVALAPSDADAHFNLAFVAGDYLREYRTALRHFREYLLLKPYATDRHLVKEKITEYELYVRSQIDSSLEDEIRQEFERQHLQDDSAPPKRRR